ncbi:MAG: hypothetical protein JKY95_19750 [Planctomycetaceae bacterium]|nr:hypothetical protein [Planctomycetaceae bacterium]
MKYTAKSIIVSAAESAFIDFIKNYGGKPMGMASPHFKGVEEFHNDTERDFKKAYCAILRAHLQDTIDEINKHS